MSYLRMPLTDDGIFAFFEGRDETSADLINDTEGLGSERGWQIIGRLVSTGRLTVRLDGLGQAFYRVKT